MNRRNYQRELEAVIKENESKSRVPRLLLHSCCAPCSSYVLEYLSDYFEITSGSCSRSLTACQRIFSISPYFALRITSIWRIFSSSASS